VNRSRFSLSQLVGVARRRLPGRARAPEQIGPGLGTFGGVFTPSILTILGVIMYLRLGWVVGNVGLGGTLLIVTLASAITFLTGLSVSAISTDQQIRTGGAYYMISRSLGVEVGGAVGIPLYLAQALSMALYTVGFAESVERVFPALDEKTVGIVTTLLVALLALRSARTAIRAQYFIMGAIALSLLSLLLGSPLAEPVSEATTAGVATEPFWVVFAVFFPAVTGIMAGVNLSGDLRNPTRSIPIGTLAAIGVGFVVYMTIPILLASRADQASLLADPLIMRRVSFWGDAILLGVWGATLSSAVGSILGAPRVLQALARDRVLPRQLGWLGKGTGEEDTPRNGTLVTLALALVAVYLGNLNIIAPILTMFFLTTYGVLNVVAGVERFVASPSYRPLFTVHWSLSLLGAVACTWVMIIINPLATILAAVLVIGVFVWLQRREMRVAWGDVRRGIWLALMRTSLLRVRDMPDPKNWRPHLLVLSGSPMRRRHLIDLASAFTHGRALMTVAAVVPPDAVSLDRQSQIEQRIRDHLEKRGVQSLVRVVSAQNPFEGAHRLVETYGLGALAPNTVLLGDSRDEAHRETFADLIRFIYEAKRHVVIVRPGEEEAFGEVTDRPIAHRRIDVWWGGLKGNGGLMMILAYLLQTSLVWRGVEVRVKMVVPTDSAADDAEQNLTALVGRIRTLAVPEVLVSGGRPFPEILRESSRDADLVFLGMAEPDENFADYFDDLRERAAGLPTTVFVLTSEQIGFGEVLR
jgi:amino acid transporter